MDRSHKGLCPWEVAMRHLSWACVAVVVVGWALPGGARAGGEGAGPALEWRAYPLRALLRGHVQDRVDRGPFPTSADRVNDEETPLFGGERDPRRGAPADYLDALERDVGQPGVWERAGASLSFAGGRLLLVRAPPDVQAQVAAWLERTERADLRTAVVDLAAFRGDPAAGRREGGVAAAVASGAWAPLGVVRLTVESSGRAIARSGTLRAYLADFDVEVAEDGNTVDPTVGVVPEGLAVEAEAAREDGNRLSVRLRGWWAFPASWASRTTPEGDRIELPTTQGTSFEATISTDGGTWTPLPSSGDVALAARARLEEVPAADPGGGLLLPNAPDEVSGDPFTLRSYDVRDLVTPLPQARATWIALFPSHYVPPSSPDLADAGPSIDEDDLLALVRATGAAGAWTREGARAERVGGALRIRADLAQQARVAALLDRLREALLPATRLRATVLALPWASLPEWWGGVPDDLLKDGGAALVARPGARVLASNGLRLREGERRASVAGTERTYVADFDVEIAKASAIGKPVVRPLLEGSSLDVEGARAGMARAASLGLRLDLDRVLDVREVPTRHGTIECPVLALGRAHGDLVVPWGTTRLAAAWGTGEEIQLVLLTAQRE